MPRIINVSTTSLEEFYINTNFIKEFAYKSRVDFLFEITPSFNSIRTFTVCARYVLKNFKDELMSLLKTKTTFEIKGITTGDESLKVLEQAVYISYSELLNHHKSKYRHWEPIAEDIAIPDDRRVITEVKKLLRHLPY